MKASIMQKSLSYTYYIILFPPKIYKSKHIIDFNFIRAFIYKFFNLV